MRDKHRARHAESSFLTLLAIAFPLIGALGGYMRAAHSHHTSPSRMALACGLLGGFIALLFCMDAARVDAVTRKVVGAVAGVIGSGITGYLLDWQWRSIAIVAVIAAVLAVFADRWVKHVTDFP